MSTFVDASAQYRPGALRDLEVSSQIEQGALSHLRTDTLGAYEAKGEVHLAGAGATGLGTPDEHADTVAAGAVRRNTICIYYGTTSSTLTSYQSVTCQNRRNPGQVPANHSSQ